MSYQRKYNLDGTINPQWKPDTRRRGGDRHKARNRKSGFVAWDGEGVTVDGVHRYVMLLSSDGDRHVDPDGLSSRACLDALVDGAMRNPQRYHTAFAFSYDVNMMLKDIPRELLEALWHGETVFWPTDTRVSTVSGYKIAYRPRREFVVKRGHFYKRSMHEIEADIARIWDVFGFFQSTFVKALESYRICDPSAIAAMKARRSVFTLDELPEIETYCKAECADLETLCERFAGYLHDAGLRVSRFDGAGAVAASMLRQRGVKRHMKPTTGDHARAVQSAYFGGRIELLQFGYAERPIYQYDLRSAYPTALTETPCLACGEWIHETEPSRIDPFSIYHVSWHYTHGDACPFPWRSRDGGVYFPRKGRGWYYGCELIAADAAARAGVITGRYQIMESWRFVPGCNDRPFGWVPEVYDTRSKWRAEGIGAEKVLKLGLNSIYGKAAQRIGGKRYGRPAPPSWHQMEWAGYATARTRAALYCAALPALARGTAVMFATDAIVATEPLDGLEIGEGLDQWERGDYKAIAAVQSGVYWLWEPDGRVVPHTRGFRPHELAVQTVLDGWRDQLDRVPAHTVRFVGLGRALMGDASWKRWRQWVPETRQLALWPRGTKRDLAPGVRQTGRGRARPDRGLVRTVPADIFYYQSKRRESTPIALPWQPHKFEIDFDPTASYAALAAADESDDGHE